MADTRGTLCAKLIILPRLLLLLLLLLLVAPRWTSGTSTERPNTPPDDAPEPGRESGCLEHRVTSGTFDEYFALEDVGNRPCGRYALNLSVTVALGNRQEELAVLLSSEDRSHRHPDFARTYEMRLTDVYTVVYRETAKLQAYHSPLDRLFPGDRFRLRFLLGREGNLTVLAGDDGPAPRTLLAVADGRPALDLRYVSFASRMNAYPVRYLLGCGMARYAPATTEAPATAADAPAPPAAAACPVCARQRCQVVVRACGDPPGRDAGTEADGAEQQQQQRYYFYFNLLLQKNRTGAGEPVGAARKPPE